MGRYEHPGHQQPNAMRNRRGDWFYPDDLDAAHYFAEHYSARPIYPKAFARHLGSPTPLRLAPARL